MILLIIILKYPGRAFDAETERKKTVEEFYRMNHINQTYDFVCMPLSSA